MYIITFYSIVLNIQIRNTKITGAIELTNVLIKLAGMPSRPL